MAAPPLSVRDFGSRVPTEILNPRRAPRVPARCTVDVRMRFAAWSAETDDVGPGGCQLVTPRPIVPGTPLRLTLHLGRLRREVAAAGVAVWSRPEAPSRAGVAFDAAADRSWFDALLAADPAAAGAARRCPDGLSRHAVLYLGHPPLRVADFAADELAILFKVGTGTTAGALLRSFGDPAPERTTGALFGLLSRRLLVQEAAAASPPEAWLEVLTRAAEVAGVRPPSRAGAAQRLLDEGLAHLAAGRTALALRRLQEARELAPWDAEIGATLRRLGPFG